MPLAQVTWAFARLGGYNRELFDAAQRDMQRKAHELPWQALAQAAWAFAQVRIWEAAEEGFLPVRRGR